MSIPSTRMVTLMSSDGKIFMVKESVAVKSKTIKNMIRDEADQIIPIPNVSGEILSVVLDYCAVAPLLRSEWKEINAWKYELAQADESTLHDLNEAAFFLDLGSLRDLIYYARKDRTTGIAVQKTRKKARIPKDTLKLSLGKESTEEEVSNLWKKTRIVNDPPEEKDFSIPNDPLELKLGRESIEEEYSIVNDPPKEYTKAEDSDSIRKDPPVEIDLLKNFGKESTKAEEKARGKRKIID